VERYKVDGKEKELLVHRKGATRAFPPYNPDVPPAYRDVGQPVLIPGDIGRYSFGSACHGAGRLMSRTKAKEYARKEGIEKVLSGIVVVARGKGTIMEEIPQAYKDVTEVVKVVDALGIAKLVARLKPLGTLKG
jgi:tRNA-splicing ligase RtcB